MHRIIYLNKGSSSAAAAASRAIYKYILHIIQNVWHGLDFTCTFKRLTMSLKLGKLEVLSTKIFFKVFGKSKPRPIEVMRM